MVRHRCFNTDRRCIIPSPSPFIARANVGRPIKRQSMSPGGSGVICELPGGRRWFSLRPVLAIIRLGRRSLRPTPPAVAGRSVRAVDAQRYNVPSIVNSVAIRLGESTGFLIAAATFVSILPFGGQGAVVLTVGSVPRGTILNYVILIGC